MAQVLSWLQNQLKEEQEVLTPVMIRDKLFLIARHRRTATKRHFKSHFPQINWMTMNDVKKDMVIATRNAASSGQQLKTNQLEEKK